MVTLNRSSCEETLQLLQHKLPHNAVAAEYPLSYSNMQ